MANNKYNPYEDAKNILKNKGNYHTAKQLGTDFEQYREAAKPYYQNLRFNGYGDLADQFEKSDYIQAQELFNGLKPDTTVDDYFASIYNETAKEQSAPKLSQAAEQTWNAYQTGLGNVQDMFGNEIRYDSNGNVVSGLGADHYNSMKNQLNYLNNFDVTAQPYYEGIMNSFQLQGNNAARGEQASGAANNAGNIDSYAQANANRQQLAFTSKGLEAALAQANQNQQNWQNAYNAGTVHLDNMYGRANESNANALNAFLGTYNTDSAERQNALNTSAELAKQEMVNKIDKYLADVGYDQAVYTADRNLEGSKYATDANTIAAQIAADADKYAAQQNYAGKVYASDTDRAIAEMELANKNGNNMYVGFDGTPVNAEGLAWQMYDAYKQGLLPDVTDAKGLADYMTALGMELSQAMELVNTILKYDKDMFKTNPASANTSTGTSSTNSNTGGLQNVLTNNYNNIFRP